MVVRFASVAPTSVSIGGFGYSVTEVLRIVGDKASARIFIGHSPFTIDDHPLITPTGRIRATFFERPARSTTSTTSFTSL